MDLMMMFADAKDRLFKLVRMVIRPKSPGAKPDKRAPGTGKGVWMAAYFDAPLADFAEYM